MTYDPIYLIDRANSPEGSGLPPGEPLPSVAPVTPGPRRGYRARSADQVSGLIKGLAQQVADAASQALPAYRPADSSQVHPGVITVITTPVASWYSVLATALLETAPQSHVPVRGALEALAAVAAFPPAVDATGNIARGLTRRIHGPSSFGRNPLFTEAELSGLWLSAVVEALLQTDQQHPRRNIRVAGIGVPPPDNSCYLLAAAVSVTLIWRPQRLLRNPPDAALGQWLLISATGDVLGGGIEKITPREKPGNGAVRPNVRGT